MRPAPPASHSDGPRLPLRAEGTRATWQYKVANSLTTNPPKHWAPNFLISYTLSLREPPESSFMARELSYLQPSITISTWILPLAMNWYHLYPDLSLSACFTKVGASRNSTLWRQTVLGLNPLFCFLPAQSWASRFASLSFSFLISKAHNFGISHLEDAH